MKSICLFVLPTLAVLVSCTPYQEIPTTISNEVEYLKTGKIPQPLPKLVAEISKIRNATLSNDVICETCDLVFTQIINYRRGGASKDSMIDFFQKLCRVFTGWGSVACDGYVSIEIDTVLFIIDNKKDLNADRICGIYFQSKTCKDPNAKKWVIPIPPPKGHLEYHNHNEARSNSTPLKILHLTDFHYDPLYESGSNAVCDLPLCCQNVSGQAPSPAKAAGYWGDYHVCDTPWYSITNFTSYLINSKEKYDFVYYTGDIISHRSWATDKKGNTDAIKKIFQHFQTVFNNTPVIPILGNHEPHPTDFWSPDDVQPQYSSQWVFDLVATEWARWLPSNTTDTIKKGGYYTILVGPKLRIVALNSNVCFISNLWLIYEDEDPYDQLKWLVEVLTQAEKDGEVVHILSHIPPGELLCLQQWSNQFRRIVQRFSAIIAAQFNGHTHLDELRLFRDVNDTKKVVNVAFNAGSFTTFVGFNPNYRTYDVDPGTFRVLDYEHFTYNLTKANLNVNKSPEWYKLYTLKTAYGLNDTANENFEDLLIRMSKNKTLVKDYFKFQGRESDPYLAQGCDDVCLDKLLCSITAVETFEAIQCQQITKKIHHTE